ncbi:sensor histidine kinase [Streptomyces sp. NPDC001774]
MKLNSSAPRSTSAESSIFRAYAHRAAGAQALLRLLLATLVILETVFSARNSAHSSTVVIAAAYSIWVLFAGFIVLQGKLLQLRPWLLLVDLGALTLLLVSAGDFSHLDATTSLLDDAFFLVPVLAVLQVKPWLTAVISLATAAAYTFGTAFADPSLWSGNHLFANMLFLFSLGLVCVLLSWLQRSRTETIANLAKDRARLLSDALAIEDRERQWLADTLHDGALQSVLAAWQDLEEIRSSDSGSGSSPSYSRIERSLLDAIRHLRATASGLHPTVLENLGLANALRAVGETTALRSGFVVSFRFDCVPNSLPDEHQKILFGAAREFLVNVAKHAEASHVELMLSCDKRGIRLAVVDDGVGVPEEERRQGLAEGHIGLASQRVRIEAVDGSMVVAPRGGDGRGTIASAVLPHALPSAPAQPPAHREDTFSLPN